jgi:hypothetical protein
VKRVKGKTGKCLDAESTEKSSLDPASHILPDTKNKVLKVSAKLLIDMLSFFKVIT